MAGQVTLRRSPLSPSPDDVAPLWVALLDGGLLLAYGDTEASARDNLIRLMREIHEATGEALRIELNRP